jgi:hypothetical protein
VDDRRKQFARLLRQNRSTPRAREKAMVRIVAVALLVANFANVVCLFRYL